MCLYMCVKLGIQRDSTSLLELERLKVSKLNSHVTACNQIWYFAVCTHSVQQPCTAGVAIQLYYYQRLSYMHHAYFSSF